MTCPVCSGLGFHGDPMTHERGSGVVACQRCLGSGDVSEPLILTTFETPTPPPPRDYGEADITDLLAQISRTGPESTDAMMCILRHQSRCWEILASGRNAENFPGRVQASRNLLAEDLKEIIELGGAL